jgi:hypothetical protein
LPNFIDGSLERSTGGNNSATVGEIIQFGDYDWRVLEVQDGRALVLSEHIIDRTMFCLFSATWEESGIRNWLNGAFLERFNQSDRARIIQSTVVNSGNAWHDNPDDNDTTDSVFLLSVEEVVLYFGDSGQLSNRPFFEERNEYARSIDDQFNEERMAFCQNAPDNPDCWGGCRMRIMGDDWERGCLSWWLRSRGDWGRASATEWGGIVFNEAGDAGNVWSGGVRPAMWISL